MEQIIILDFGSPYTQLIARRVRECKVYCLIKPYTTAAAEIATLKPRGLILSGGPLSASAANAPRPDPAIYQLGVPVLGIAYGLQVMALELGGGLEPAAQREYGKVTLKLSGTESALFRNVEAQTQVWSSPGGRLSRLPEGFIGIGSTPHSDPAAVEEPRRRFYGVQFHPEVVHSLHGYQMLSNFVHEVCGCGESWTMQAYRRQAIEQIRAQVGDEHVILGLSGGVDSSVAAVLLQEAIGERLTCIFVNNGLLRAGEAESVRDLFCRNFNIRLHYEDASELFLSRLAGVTDPEKKRAVIGNSFIEVFEAAQKKVGHARFLAQGTVYPDVIESIAADGNPATLVKSHHNVGGLPSEMRFELVEPFRYLFKDEVRELGEVLGLSRELVWRQPFPGPGLGVRLVGEITPERLRILREADAIVTEEMRRSDWYYKVWQSFAVLLPVRSVGVKGDLRTYEETVALRVVESLDGMTADWVRLPYELLELISRRILSEVPGVSRVCYDISHKPPSTIEWE